jgi:hypothetical protein
MKTFSFAVDWDQSNPGLLLKRGSILNLAKKQPTI